MKFLVDYGSKKAGQKLLKLPPLLQKRLKFVLYFGGASAAAIKHRVADRGLAADFSKIKKYNRSGGMWSGWQARIIGQHVQIEFLKTSLPTAAAKLLEKDFEDPKDRRQYVKRLRADKKLKKVSNRLKARTCATSKSAGARMFQSPSRDEVNAMASWVREHLERNILDIIGKDFRHRAVPDRFNILMKRLPDPKSKG
jgi:hypothetical protein